MQGRLADMQKNQWRRWEQEFRKADPQRTGMVNTMQLRRILRQLVGSVGDGDFRRLVNAMQQPQQKDGKKVPQNGHAAYCPFEGYPKRADFEKGDFLSG